MGFDKLVLIGDKKAENDDEKDRKPRYNSKNQEAWYLGVGKSCSVKGKAAALIFIGQTISTAVVDFAFWRCCLPQSRGILGCKQKP